jgi:hypothetical protein
MTTGSYCAGNEIYLSPYARDESMWKSEGTAPFILSQ